jgi:LacI family transcriptional regulator
MSKPKTTRPTMLDVARASGHSLSTVDRVLNGRSTVRADTAQHIQQAAEALGYYAVEVIRERVREAKPRRKLGFLLQQPGTPFYQNLAQALAQATAACPQIQGLATVEYLSSQSPDRVAAHLLALGSQVDAVAVVAADHPLLNEAIAQLHAGGVPIFALVSDLSAPQRAGYAGLDSRRMGRTAAWIVTELARAPGPVAVFVGSHRFQCQELTEISFRSYMREHAPAFELLESIPTLESSDYAEERTLDLLQRRPDLCGFYVGGGGIDGVLRALRSRPSQARLVGVANDLTAVTRSALLDGQLHAVLSHPLPQLCSQLVAHMAEALAQPSTGLRQGLVPLEIHLPQSV